MLVICMDQQALSHIYKKKPLDEIGDKISDIAVSTYHFNFPVEYVEAKNNMIADFL